MIALILKRLFRTVLGRWVTGSVVALLLGGGALMWHNHKADLREEGRQECIQLVNEETMLQLEAALVEERRTNAELVALAEVNALANVEALARRQELETSLTALAAEMEKQRNEDPEYKEWGDAPLPDGVAERMREQATGSDPGTLRDDGS